MLGPFRQKFKIPIFFIAFREIYFGLACLDYYVLEYNVEIYSSDNHSDQLRFAVTTFQEQKVD